MSRVFLGGSRTIARLSTLVKDRVDTIVSRHLDILVGDANGADKAFQDYLATLGYERVTVFCAGNVCRNNLGNWKAVFVSTGSARRGFEHYAEKDRRMAEEADHGLFLWNGKSRGTLNSMRMLARRRRPALVYVSSRRKFATVRDERDLNILLNESGSAATDRRSGRKRATTPVGQRRLLA